MRFSILTVLLVACFDKDDEDPIDILDPSDEAKPESQPDSEPDSGVDTDIDPNDPNNIDDDGDGFTENEGDCNDEHAQIYPGAEEIPDDDVDQDCDGEDDETQVDSISIEQVGVGELIVTEIMKNPEAVHGEFGEWFEIYNTLDVAVDLNGLILRDSGQDAVTIVESVMIAPAGYFIFGASGNPSQNGGVGTDYAYDRGQYSLANGEDEVILANSNGEIDAVAYDDVLFPDADGVALNLAPDSYDAVSNDSGSNWCDAQISYGQGDLGSPGGSNTTCPQLPDVDGDGYTSDVDCNDSNFDINPGVDDDVCNGVDGNCDGNLDEDWQENSWTGQSYEPNESTSSAYQLGTDSNGGSDSSTADLDQAGTITAEAYIFDDSDIDAFAFTSYDDTWSDFGFDITIDSVPSTVDIALAIDFLDTNGTLITDLVVVNDAGAGGSEEVCIGDTLSTCSNRFYESGTWIIRTYAVNVGGEDCSDSYLVTIVD